VQIQSYRFGQAERLQYGTFPALDTVFYRWARALEEVLFEEFRTEVYAGSSVVEEMRFNAFHSSLKHARPIYFFNLEPFQGTGLLVLDNRFAGLCADPEEARRAGGQQAPAPLTREGNRRMQQVVERMGAEFDRAWEGLHEVRLRLRKVTTTIFRARVLNAYEPCLVAQLHLSGEGISSRLMMCLPRASLEPVLPALRDAAIIPTVSPVRQVPEPAALDDLMDDASYGVTVRLGQIESTLDAAQLRVGGVFALESFLGREAALEINGEPVLMGTMGESEGRYAVRVTGPFRPHLESAVKHDAPFRPLRWPTVR
jgi:flagellar motor switch protein FliM